MVLEQIVQQQVDNYFEYNNLFGEYQFGFRQRKSTTSELLALFEELHEAKESHMEIALLLWDLSAAFDTIEPSILIRKLECYGFDRIAIEWMTSYLKKQEAGSLSGRKSFNHPRYRHWYPSRISNFTSATPHLLHTDLLCSKLKQRLSLLRRINHKVPSEKFKIIAEAIFSSKLRYGISIYLKPRLSDEDELSKDLNRLQVLQNDMLRVIIGKRRSQHVNMKELREEMRIM